MASFGDGEASAKAFADFLNELARENERRAREQVMTCQIIDLEQYRRARKSRRRRPTLKEAASTAP
jgi:hypothetical protein